MSPKGGQAIVGNINAPAEGVGARKKVGDQPLAQLAYAPAARSSARSCQAAPGQERLNPFFDLHKPGRPGLPWTVVNRLRELREPGETFSEVILRLKDGGSLSPVCHR